LGLGHGLLPVSGGSATGLAWHRTEPVMGHTQHLFFESLVKMDHFQKGATKKGPLGHKGGRKGQYVKEQIGNPAQTECPLWVISGQTVPG